MFLTITNTNISAGNVISGKFMNLVKLIHPSLIDEGFCGTGVKQHLNWCKDFMLGPCNLQIGVP